MRLIITADLHYDIARSAEPARRIAEEICGLRADGLLLLGDAGGRDISIVSECLHLFDSFTGLKLFVAGNHDIWTQPGEDSLTRFEQELPEVCREAGFHPLDLEPVRLDGVGIVGSMGWYDFSFRPARLGIPLRFYREKISPGAAARLPQYEHLLADDSDIPETALSIGSRWMDGEHVRLPLSDADFCRRLLARIEDHLQDVGRCDQIVVGMHHLPFEELVPHTQDPGWAFASAFMGSAMFGQLMIEHPKVRHAFCGHSHRPGRVHRGHLQCINVGSTYTEKRYEVLEV